MIPAPEAPSNLTTSGLTKAARAKQRQHLRHHSAALQHAQADLQHRNIHAQHSTAQHKLTRQGVAGRQPMRQLCCWRKQPSWPWTGWQGQMPSTGSACALRTLLLWKFP